MAASPTIRRRLPPLVALAIVAALALGACKDRPVDPGTTSMDGLLLLTGDLRASTTLADLRRQPVPDGDGRDARRDDAGSRGGRRRPAGRDARRRDAARPATRSDPGGKQSWRKADLVDAEGARGRRPVPVPELGPGRRPLRGPGRRTGRGPAAGRRRSRETGPRSSTCSSRRSCRHRRPGSVTTGSSSSPATDDALTSSVVDTASGDAVRRAGRRAPRRDLGGRPGPSRSPGRGATR